MLKMIQKALETSIKSLVSSLLGGVAKAKTLNNAMKMRAVAALTVLKGMNRNEELRLLYLFIVSETGRMGIQVPDVIARFGTSVPEAKPKPVAVKRVATPASPQRQVPPAQQVQPEAGPPRTVQSSKQRVESLLSLLEDFLNIGKRLKSDKMAKFVASVLPKYASFFREREWKVLFRAMDKANKNGFYIVGGRGVNLGEFFAVAPKEPLREYIFGKEGALSQVMEDLRKNSEDMPPWLVAKTFTLVVAIKALDGMGLGLTGSELAQMETLGRAIQTSGGPDKLLDKIYHLVDMHKETTVPLAKLAVGDDEEDQTRLRQDMMSVVPDKKLNGQADGGATAKSMRQAIAQEEAAAELKEALEEVKSSGGENGGKPNELDPEFTEDFKEEMLKSEAMAEAEAKKEAKSPAEPDPNPEPAEIAVS